ncbi:MAG: hypothetical protein ABI036_16120, partial [Fibrobacteria bacterium]
MDAGKSLLVARAGRGLYRLEVRLARAISGVETLGDLLLALPAASAEDGAIMTRAPTMAIAREREVRGFAIFMLI